MTTTSPRRPGGAEAMREAAAKAADDIGAGMAGHVIRLLPLPAGDTLSTGGWNSDMEKAPRDMTPFLLATRSYLGGVAMVYWPADSLYPVDDQGDIYPDGTAWHSIPEPPPGE